MLKKLLSVFLFLFLIFIILTLYFIDKEYILCPIEYKEQLLIRNDRMGSGAFGALRAGNRLHEGIDLYALIGTDVKAASFGLVVEAGFHKRLGYYVELRHPGGLSTIYGHLSNILVKPGSWIRQGSIIGYVGKTGNARYPAIQPHLHFEIRKDGIPIDPIKVLEGR